MCLDCGAKVKALLPKCMINSGVRCQGALKWCMEISTKYGKEVIVTVKIIGVFMFTFDLGTDSFTGVHYINIGKVPEGIIILIFTILPMLCISLRLVIHASLGGRKSKRIGCLPSLTATVCSPILPLGWLVLDVVASIGGNNSDNGNDNNNVINEDTRLTAERAAKLIKMFVAVGESYPQTIIQLFIIFASLAVGEDISIWLWISIAVSIISLSHAVSTGYLNAEAATSSKVGFFVFGTLALCSRQVVCCVYSMHKSVLWLVPFCSQLVSSIIIQSISSKCQGKWAGLLIFVLTEAYNSFTLSGLLTSTIYLGFAIGGLLLKGNPLDLENAGCESQYCEPVLTIALVLASVSWAFNVLFTAVPQCRGFRNDWMKKPDVEITQPDTKGTISDAEVAQLDAVGTSSKNKEIQSDMEEAVTVIETHPDSRKYLTYDKGNRSDSVESFQYVKETQCYDNEILPDNENDKLDAKEIHVDPGKPVSETEGTYL